jgi:3-oxoacyl-[acyl-carrier-protein] synthase III
MSTIDVLIEARKIADEAGVEWRDLDALLPEQQLASIRDRITRKLLALREEMIKHETQRFADAFQVAA